MKRYNVLHGLALSLFSGDFYRDVGLNWRGVGYGYLILLLLITWCPILAVTLSGFNRFMADQAPPIIAQVPPIHIKDGVASCDAEQPYNITIPQTDEILATIDTTGQVNSLDDTAAQILLTADELMVRKNGGRSETYALSEMKDQDFDLDATKLQGWAEKFTGIVMWVLPIAMVVFSICFRIVQNLIYAAVGLWLASMQGVRLSYGSLMRLSAVAVTAVIYLDTILWLTGVNIGCVAGLLGIAIAMFYLWFGIRSCAGASGQGDDFVPLSQQFPPPPQA